MSPTHRRPTVVALSAASGLLGWAALRTAGTELTTDARTVGAVDVLVAALVAGLAATLTAGWLARHARRPRTAWTLLGSTVLSASMLGPIYSAPDLTAVAR